MSGEPRVPSESDDAPVGCLEPGRLVAKPIIADGGGVHHPVHDPALEEFGDRMARIERVTRIACTVAGVLFGIVTIVLLATGFALGALAFLFPTVVCLARGLGRFGADLEAVGPFRVLGFLRWTPYPWWLYGKKR